jgi:tetratricopeptide (TPR) repeat protein
MAALAESAALIDEARRQRNAGKLREAERTCREALANQANDADAHRMLATILHEQGSYEAAFASFDEASRLDPGDAKTYKQLAGVLFEHARTEEALAACRKALALRPGYAGALAIVASLKRFRSPDDADLATLETLIESGEGLSDAERGLLLFALGKAYEDLGDSDRAFAYLQEANDLKRATLAYDVERDVDYLERVASSFDGDLVGRLAGAGSRSDLPILIVGMPRSGTSLVEQILASHPAVHGGGERPDLREIATVVSVLGSGEGFPEGIASVARDDLARLGEGYAHRLQRLAAAAARVTDKGLLNFSFLGFAQLILPRARVIHCVREPLDTCVSCFALNLEDLAFTYDFSDLGRYHRAYAKLMEHWRSVLPKGAILEVRYEDLVDDLEGEARRLFDYCDLPWNDSCLRFHSTKRVVRTASAAQVRKPLYNSSVGRWRKYEQHLGPLKEALAVDQMGARDGN